tara:strand:- start:363 stop:542 length:180 start_codon:yes stop_codon:yes gene_type:complete
MSVREITIEMVRAALANPTRTGIGYKSRLLACKSSGTRTFKVVYTKEDERFIIISVIWD